MMAMIHMAASFELGGLNVLSFRRSGKTGQRFMVFLGARHELLPVKGRHTGRDGVLATLRRAVGGFR